MKSYDLSRNFWNWAFDNPELISTNHAAIYFFAIEHCNRLGGKEKFGFPSLMTMDAVGIKKHQTYIKYFNELVEYGFFKLIQKSTNQYSSNIISLISAIPKKGKALDKAFITHAAKQTQSKGQSKVHVDKQVNKEQINKETINSFDFDYKIELTNYIKHLQESYNRAIGHMQIEQMIKMLDSWYTSKQDKLNCISMNISSGWKTLNFVEPNNSEKKIDYTQDVLSK